MNTRLACAMLLLLTLTSDNWPASAASNCDYIAFAGGAYFSLGLQGDGTVWAFGDNRYGQLGIGTVSPSVPTPTQVVGLGNVVAIAAGSYFSLALLQDGTVWAWGDNSSGELGNGSTVANSPMPVQVSSIATATAIGAGAGVALAVLSDGTIRAWGGGPLGDGTTNTSNVPVSVSSLTGVRAVACGEGHCLALKGDGTVSAWGGNSFGQLGDGTMNNAWAPVAVNGLPAAMAIAGGRRHSLAVANDGTVWGWGNNGSAQLGIGSTTGNYSSPVQAVGLTGAQAVSAGELDSVAVTTAGEFWTWGRNELGAFCAPAGIARFPLHQPAPANVTSAAAGLQHMLLLAAGTPWSCGNNDRGELGIGSSLPSEEDTPVKIMKPFDAVPGDQGNTLRGIGQGVDVSLLFTLATAQNIRVFRDLDKLSLGLTALSPDTTTGTFLDGNARLSSTSYYYRIKGLSCSLIVGP